MGWSRHFRPASSWTDSLATGRADLLVPFKQSSVMFQVNDEALVHDSYHCKTLPFGHWRPWPTQREKGEESQLSKILIMRIFFRSK